MQSQIPYKMTIQLISCTHKIAEQDASWLWTKNMIEGTNFLVNLPTAFFWEEVFFDELSGASPAKPLVRKILFFCEYVFLDMPSEASLAKVLLGNLEQPLTREGMK